MLTGTLFFGVVPGVGLEPTRGVTPSDFESDANANSAIPALYLCA